MNTRHGKGRKIEEASDGCHFDEERSRVTNVPIRSEVNASVGLVSPPSRLLDLNTEVFLAKSPLHLASGNLDFTNKLHKCSDNNSNHVTARGIDLDLNVEDVSSSVKLEIDSSFKNCDELKSRDVSECASSTGPPGEKDPLKLWTEMKQNGFLSSSIGGIPAPKQRGRRSKNEAHKKKMEIAKREKKLELAKKEQVDRFPKLAAPSGLLNELNPGIINHVRNRKQVHSIIEAIVKSEKQEQERLASKHLIGNRNRTEGSTNENVEDANEPDINLLGSLNNFSLSRQTRGSRSPLITEGEGMDSRQIMLDRITGKNCDSQSNTINNKETLALELSSSHVVSDNACLMSNDEGKDLTCISSLSLKAATVACQWLELIHQDIKGRLSALRRSKKRVRAVISTDLPFLISKEFSSNEENYPFIEKNVSDGNSSIPSADVHQARWAKLFNQMDIAVAEEEKQLESWLNQVKEMLLHCNQGLNHVQSSDAVDLQHSEEPENDSRTRKMAKSERELAVGAAAASIYSTCNFLVSENVSCF